MKKVVSSSLFWLPRILGILFALFLALFVLEAAEAAPTVSDRLLAAAVELIPAVVVAFVLAVAWHWERTGGTLFAILAIFYIASVKGFPTSTYILISGPLALIGLCFWIHSLVEAHTMRQHDRRLVG